MLARRQLTLKVPDELGMVSAREPRSCIFTQWQMLSRGGHEGISQLKGFTHLRIPEAEWHGDPGPGCSPSAQVNQVGLLMSVVLKE